MRLSAIMEELDGDVLLIVPPFARVNLPSLGVHVLQACARTKGIRVDVLYGNLHFGSDVEPELLEILKEGTGALLGERLFARAAGSTEAFGRNADRYAHLAGSWLPALQRHEARTTDWADEIAGAIVDKGFRIVGCTSSFEQSNASVSLLARVKRLAPHVVTIMGGANCEAPMASEILNMSAGIDYVFSGESETTFVSFLHDLLEKNQHPSARVLKGAPNEALDDIPTPDFQQYFDQLGVNLPYRSPQESSVAYETSRGCWWGQKRHCTFCGLNANGMSFRTKSADKVLSDLQEFSTRYPTRRIFMVDNIMPFTYFRSVLPALSESQMNLKFFYEEKSNLSLEQLIALRESGILSIQPGVEALSTNLLKLMDKGVSARQNLQLLRDARVVGIDLNWSLLTEFPGDRIEDYEHTRDLLPLLHHLQPPLSVSPVQIDRFSPYFENPERYGVRNITPLPSYRDVFSDEVDPHRVAYRFTAEYASGSRENPHVIRQIEAHVADWQSAWASEVNSSVTLRLVFHDGAYRIVDTRGLPGNESMSTVDEELLPMLLFSRRFEHQSALEEATAKQWGVLLDGYYVPLMTASLELLLRTRQSMVAMASGT